VQADDDLRQQVERYRSYLRVLARVQLGPRWHAHVDPSDLVQQTLLKAVQAAEQFRGEKEAELAAWLRQILARTLANIQRDLTRDCRDITRERSLEAGLEASSALLAGLIADPGASPSEQVEGKERLLRLAAALEELPGDQREAIERHHLRSEKLDEVAAVMGRGTSAVAGLIKRGMKDLREKLQEIL
jgi:RNA polymerase sigma-70 factor (ECF subfamily)